jgi:diguanylate cyclase (GGDEF)-like protein
LNPQVLGNLKLILLNIQLVFVSLLSTPGTNAGHAGTAGIPENVLVGQSQVLIDPSARATLDQVLTQQGNFKDVTKTTNYGFSSSALWFRIPVQNLGDQPVTLFLDIQNPLLDHVVLYVVASGQVLASSQSGDRIPARNRPYRALSIVLPVQLGAHRSAELYLRVWGEANTLVVPISITDEGAVKASDNLQRTILQIVIGVYVALFFHNLMAYVHLRDRSYLYYSAALFFIVPTILFLQGYGSEVLFPADTWWNNEGIMVFAGLQYAMLILYSRFFLQTGSYRGLDRILQVTLGFSVLLVLSPIIAPVRVACILGLVLSMILPALLATSGILMWRRGQQQARFYVAGNTAGLLGMFIYATLLVGVVPFTPVLVESTTISLAAGAILFGLALSDRISLLQKAKSLAEEEARRNLEIHQKQLEKLVGDRMTELELARKQAELLATIDQLTGIYNRRGLLQLAERELEMARRSGRTVSLIAFDLDRFKHINDRFGHAEGDRVLRETVVSVSQCVRASDLLGRIGGDEFLLVMPETTSKTAAEIAERLRKHIRESIAFSDREIKMTASFGVISTIETGNDLEKLQAAADSALYRAKKRGRNRVEVGMSEPREAKQVS